MILEKTRENSITCPAYYLPLESLGRRDVDKLVAGCNTFETPLNGEARSRISWMVIVLEQCR